MAKGKAAEGFSEGRLCSPRRLREGSNGRRHGSVTSVSGAVLRSGNAAEDIRPDRNTSAFRRDPWTREAVARRYLTHTNSPLQVTRRRAQTSSRHDARNVTTSKPMRATRSALISTDCSADTQGKLKASHTRTRTSRRESSGRRTHW